ncbi:MAG: hypothetical protein KDH09_01750 [Chrysiogenetes bacterium]|nr:hypothetical protein [Chrysiogenetes bacterium]
MAKEILIVQSKVKDIIKKKNFQCSAEAIEAFSAQLEESVNKALARAKANGRKTVKAQDV